VLRRLASAVIDAETASAWPLCLPQRAPYCQASLHARRPRAAKADPEGGTQRASKTSVTPAWHAVTMHRLVAIGPDTRRFSVPKGLVLPYYTITTLGAERLKAKR